MSSRKRSPLRDPLLGRRFGRLTSGGYERPLFMPREMSPFLEENEDWYGETAPLYLPLRPPIGEWSDLADLYEAVPDWWSPRLYSEARSWRTSFAESVSRVNGVPDEVFEERPDCFVYIARRSDGLIKIGSSHRIDLRMSHLGTELLHSFPGGYAEERALLQRFKPWVAEGREWFYPVPELLDFIADLLVDKPDSVESAAA